MRFKLPNTSLTTRSVPHKLETEQDLISYYNDRISTYGPSVEAVQWQSQYTQYKRYQVILNHLNKSSKTLCDVGCGCGDFFHYVTLNQYPIDYHGIDISANMIVQAQRTYPKGHFQCLTIEDLLPNHTYDTIIASGIMNLRLNNQTTYITTLIKNMLTLSKKQVIFNILSEKAKRFSRSKTFIYYSKSHVTAILDSLQIRYKIIEDYLPNDMTIILEKE